MGRLAKLPVTLSQGVTVKSENDTLLVTGPKGSISRAIPKRISIRESEEGVYVDKKGDSKQINATHGTMRAHLANMVKGVSEGWSKQLEITGPGYRAEARGKELVINAGHSHPVIIAAPEGISFKVEKGIITVEGHDKEVVGQTSALIRKVRKPNPYSGSGIRYIDEVVRRKAGKQAGAKE